MDTPIQLKAGDLLGTLEEIMMINTLQRMIYQYKIFNLVNPVLQAKKDKDEFFRARLLQPAARPSDGPKTG